MKKNSIRIALFVLTMFCTTNVFSQPGYITTIAGNGTSGFSGDGGSATAATMGQALGVAVDNAGNIYIADDDNNRIRKIDPSGVITTFAGGGSSTADNIPATDASLNLSYVAGALAVDASGNVYVGDRDRVRKINVATNIITTVAGTISAGFSGDGGLATAAQLSAPVNFCFDGAGNMYIADDNNQRIRKVNTAGIISTYAGNGTASFGGDAGPATAAQLYLPSGVCIDASGNLYIAENYNYRIRKVSPSGIISTYAGNGSSGGGGDGGQATAASFSEPSRVCMDSYGNLYIADFHNGRVRMVTPSGIVTTFAGGGSSGVNTGVPATDASLTDVWGICIDNLNNIYIADRNHNQICRVGLGIPFAASDSLSVFVNALCAGPDISIATSSYGTSYTQVTSFGDGNSYSSAVPPTASLTSCYLSFPHSYALPGTYSLKTVLSNGGVAIDSVMYTYQYKMCNTLQTRFYLDVNNSFAYESGADVLSNLPVTVEIDSNGVPIDTISATSGFYYTAYGAVGDIYKMKVISSSGGLIITSPASGLYTDTLQTVTYNLGMHDFGFSCAAPGHNYRIYTANQCGSHHFGGEIIVDNLYCSTSPATVTIHTSPKYQFQSASPAPTSVLGNTITWVLPVLSAMAPPVHISLSMESPAGVNYLPGDTVNSFSIISPVIGDIDTTDNTCHHTDTVKSGYDPNFIEVSPAGYVASGSQLQYTIGFENTGNDTAFNIYVLDTLSDDLDPATLTIVTASAAMDIYKFTAGGHTIVKFDFPHINLLDSSHHDACHGMVIYTIKTKTGLPDCTHIPAEAGIYFDLNPVVMTNMVQTIIGIPPVAPAITGTTSVCVSSAVSLTASVAGGTWSVSNTNASVSTSGVVTGNTAGIVFVYYTIPGVCDPITSQFLMTVGPPSAGSIASASSICLGSSIVLTSSVPGGTWMSYNTNATISGNILTGATIGTDTIYYTVITACGVAVTQQTISIDNPAIAAPLAGPASVCAGSTITLTDAVAGGVWGSYYGLVSVSATGVVTGITAGVDSVIYTVSNGCGWSSAKKGVTVIPASACGSVSIGTEPVAGPSLNIYPNPANNELYIVTDDGAYRSLTITNNVGQVVLQKSINTAQTQLDIAPLSPGFYYITLTGNNGNVVKKFVKM